MLSCSPLLAPRLLQGALCALICGGALGCLPEPNLSYQDPSALDFGLPAPPVEARLDAEPPLAGQEGLDLGVTPDAMILEPDLGPPSPPELSTEGLYWIGAPLSAPPSQPAPLTGHLDWVVTPLSPVEP